MAILTTILRGPQGVRDIMLRNLKLAEREVRMSPPSVDAATLVAAIASVISTDLEVSNKKKK